MSTKFLPQITVPFPKMTLFVIFFGTISSHLWIKNFPPTMPCAFGFAIVPTNCCASIFVEGHGERIVSTWKIQKMLGTTFKHMGLSNSKALVVFHLLKKLVRSWMYAILQYLCTSGVLLFRTRLPFTQLERVAHSRQAWKDVETSWSCKITATATKPNAKFATTISSWPSVPQSNRFIWR